MEKDSIFDRLGDAADRANIARQTEFSRAWFLNKAKSLAGYNFAQLERESQGKTKQRLSVGKMYAYQYDPKGKNELPYFDKFPLILVLGVDKGYFLGCNFHYIAPVVRAKILGRLLKISSSKTLDERTKIKLTYAMIKSISSFKLLQPTIKKYLKSHVRSKLIQIDADEMEICVFLPTESFMKGRSNKFKPVTSKYVWNDSRNLTR
jgi:hypothetical protein